MAFLFSYHHIIKEPIAIDTFDYHTFIIINFHLIIFNDLLYLD